MIRYRCPHCAALIVAHERRIGQSSVCKVCVKPHSIPADPALWLNESGGALPVGPLIDRPTAPVASVEHVSDLPIISDVPVRDPVPEPRAIPVLWSIEPAPEPPSAPVESEPEPVPEIEPEPLPPSVAARTASVSDFELPELPPAELPHVELPAPEAPLPAPSVVISVREPEPAQAPEPVRPAVPQSLVAVAERPVAERPADSTPPPEPAVVTITPPPERSRPLAVPSARGAGRFVPAASVAPDAGRAEPVQLQTQADIAAALTAALTSRMKPVVTPRRDLRPSTAAWMLLTAVGVTLTVLALFSDADYRWPLLAVGLIQVVAGYVWIVRLTRFRDPTRGLLCAIPPLTAYYLSQYKYAKYRPLRFVATGAVLVALAGATPALIPHTRALVNRSGGAPPPDPAAMSKLAQLRASRDHRSYDSLSRQLELLAKTDPLLSADAKDRAELSAELRALCDHPDTGVKVRAMVAYTTWDPPNARKVCLAAVRSATAEEREWALRLLPQWKDVEVARAVQSLIGRPGSVESNRAKDALEQIGGVPAEQAAIELLTRAEVQGTKLTALAILEKVGGLETAGWLRSSYAAAADDTAVRDRALVTSDAIKARLRLPVPKAAPAPTP